MRKPWLKWYPADWRDIRLRRCSLEARGLLIELIGIMHEAEPYGHIVINGQVPSDAEIGRIIGVDTRIVRRLTTALIEAGVLSRTTEGVVYSRRMVRDHEKALSDQAHGGHSGNPALLKGVNPPVKPEVKAQKPEVEAREMMMMEKWRARRRRDAYLFGFI